MEDKLIKKFLDDVYADKFHIRKLKQLALDTRNLELASEIRDIENKWCPEADEEEKEKSEAIRLESLFRMVGLNIPEDVCWVINKTMSRYKARRGNFDLKDSEEIRVTKLKMYGE